MRYSVILPVYNEQESVENLYERLRKVLKIIDEDYEMIFVNDGSTDSTLEILTKLNKKDKGVKIINFSRNFGHQMAVSAGLRLASGDRVAILDADLQDPPEVLKKFFTKLGEGYDVVYAVRVERKEGFFKKLSYNLFYRLLKKITDTSIPLDSGDFCVMNRRVVDAINSLPERNRFVRGLRSWVGFRQIGIPYERASRYAGVSKYTFSKLVKLAFDGIFSFSYIPLQLMFFLGLLSLIFSFLGIAFAVYSKFFTTHYQRGPGFATTIILVMFVGGLQLFSLGVVGEYMRRIYDETKARPPYMIESMIGFEDLSSKKRK